jgi:hypothetical protein
MLRTARIVASVAALLFALLMLYATLTVPAISATAPALLTIAFGVLAWFVWPHRKSATTREP